MRTAGIISVAGVMFILQSTVIATLRGHTDMTQSQSGCGQYEILFRKGQQISLVKLCSYRTKHTKNSLLSVARRNNAGPRGLFSEACSKRKEYRDCMVKYLDCKHKCGANGTDVLFVLVDKFAEFACENNGSKLADIILRGGACASKVVPEVTQCLNMFHGVSLPEEKPGRKECDHTRDNAEWYYCKLFHKVSECAIQALKKCVSEWPYTILESIFEHVKRNSFCKNYIHDEKVIGIVTKGNMFDVGQCENGTCVLSSVTADIGSVGPTNSPVSTDVTTSILPFSDFSAESNTTSQFSDYISEHSKSKFSESSRTMKSKGLTLELRLYNAILLPCLIILQCVK